MSYYLLSQIGFVFLLRGKLAPYGYWELKTVQIYTWILGVTAGSQNSGFIFTLHLCTVVQVFKVNIGVLRPSPAAK